MSTVPTIAPTFGDTPTEIEKQQWRVSASRDAAALLLDADKARIRMTAMALVDFQLNGGRDGNAYFDDRLAELSLKAGGEKVMMRAAIVASGLNREDPVDGTKSAKILDAMATEMEGLERLVGEDAGFTYSYTEACVNALIEKVLKTTGGLRALANVVRVENAADNERKPIALDPVKVGEMKIARAQDRLASSTSNVFELVTHDLSGMSQRTGIFLDIEAVMRAMAEGDIEEGKAQALHELQLATIAIAREPTDKVVVHGTDPKDKRVEKRKTEPHIVYCPEGRFVISGHLASAGNVVEISDLEDVFAIVPDFHVMLPPEAHKSLGRNLEKSDQRNVIEIVEEAPAKGTKSIYRTMRLRSDAARLARYRRGGEGVSISWRYPTYGSTDAEDTVPDIRGDRKWSAPSSFTMSGDAGFENAIVGGRSRLDHDAHKRRSVAISLDDGVFTVITKNGSISCAGVSGKPFGVAQKMFVAAADLRGLLALLDAVKADGLELSLDREGAAVKWSFGSFRAQYHVTMPCAGETGTRLGAAFKPLQVVTPTEAAARAKKAA